MKPLSLLLLFGSVTTAALAAPVMFTFSGFATGTFNATAFTNAAFTVTSSGDTSSVFVVSGSVYEVPALSASIDINGFATALFSDSTFWADPQGSGDIEFGDATLNTVLLGFTQLFQGLETYQFQTSIGPISSGIVFSPNIFENFQNIATSQGSLTITSTSSNTFTAVVVPEPASGWFAAAGLAALLLTFLIGRFRVRSLLGDV